MGIGPLIRIDAPSASQVFLRRKLQSIRSLVLRYIQRKYSPHISPEQWDSHCPSGTLPILLRRDDNR